MTGLKPCGRYVLLEFFKGEKVQKESSGGIVMPGFVEKPDYAILRSVGEKVDLTKETFKLGDKIFFNEYDAKQIDDFDTERHFILTKAESIMASYE